MTNDTEKDSRIFPENHPSIHLIRELNKANNAYGNLHARFDVAYNFIRKIVFDWKCDPNHAESILSELERMKND